ncbi:hypothetical protein GCM10011332_23360 [Terasakiella brassicae]|uniref:Uncharacterized protein n=1 Tax=Terasakiella brassicae TaxID=1634917 RepID=A0A917C213_9PROT|nr:hypothetical protein GCM10011332_23360 [Terasakiella brassicae]
MHFLRALPYGTIEQAGMRFLKAVRVSLATRRYYIKCSSFVMKTTTKEVVFKPKRQPLLIFRAI